MQFLSAIEPHVSFEDLYIRVRSKEQRLLDDAVVAQLPYPPEGKVPNAAEWKVRAASIEKLKKWFASLKQAAKLLDIGCGNGWAAARLAEHLLLDVVAIDVNVEELEQAERVFKKPNLSFCYGDIFEDIFPEASFDFIVLNASAQYFPDLPALIGRLLYFLKKDGTIHIVDTPFYQDDEIAAAKARSERYYASLDCTEMAAHYFHHKLSDLRGFNVEMQLPSRGMVSRLKSLLSQKATPGFAWLQIRHNRNN
jgi:SAM-dependent methyltransferase